MPGPARVHVYVFGVNFVGGLSRQFSSSLAARVRVLVCLVRESIVELRCIIVLGFLDLREVA